MTISTTYARRGLMDNIYNLSSCEKNQKMIYIKTYPEEKQIVYSGIKFADFIEFLPQPIENLVVISGNCSSVSFDVKYERRFEWFEGYDQVKKLAVEDVHKWGDFCFVDYDTLKNTHKLSEEQIAELLYLGRMFKPLKYPFFEPLQNRFVYLSHDDGFYCKLYCKEFGDFFTVLYKQIISCIDVPLLERSKKVEEQLLQLAMSGILIDLEEIKTNNERLVAPVYTIGEYADMDSIFNNVQDVKNAATQINNIILDFQELKDL